MSRRTTSIYGIAVTSFLLAAGGALALPLLGARSADSLEAVGQARLARALASDIPRYRTMSDAIAHYERRAAQRPQEAFSREYLFQAHMLAFRAYGHLGHLESAADALTQLDELSSSEPSESLIRSRSSLALAEHDFETALTSARLLIARSSDPDEAARYRLFDALWAVGQWEEARGLLDGRVDTLSTAYFSRSARVLDAADGRVEPARDLFRRVVENARAYAEPAPVRAWALVELGHFELHSGHAHDAVRRYEEALEVLPGSPAALEGLAAVAYGVDRNLETAWALYRKALAHGAHLDLMPTLADIEEALGRPEEADRLRSSFIDSATADPKSEAMNRRPLALLLAETPGEQLEAVRLARADLSTRQDPGAFDTLAWALLHAGETAMAWTIAQRGLNAGAPAPPALFRGGLIAHAAGEQEEAKRLLDEALEGQVELAPHEVRRARQIMAVMR